MGIATSMRTAGAVALILAQGLGAGLAPTSAVAQTAPSKETPQTRPAPPLIVAPIRPRTAQVPVAAPRAGDDRDGDGSPVPQDCDDGDASRYPGNTETADDRDNDCNSTTIGERDADGDGFTDFRVSNVASYGPAATAGLDCDDSQAGINTNAQELPNRLDDNCDGLVDNLLGTWWTPR